MLRGFDEYMNIVLNNVKAYSYSGEGGKRMLLSHEDSILLNGAHICLMIPGENPPPKGVNE